MNSRRGFLGQLLAAAAFTAVSRVVPALAYSSPIAPKQFNPSPASSLNSMSEQLRSVYSAEVFEYVNKQYSPWVEYFDSLPVEPTEGCLGCDDPDCEWA